MRDRHDHLPAAVIAGCVAGAQRFPRGMDTARIVFPTPIMTNAGRYTDLRGDQVKTVVDDYHLAGREETASWRTT